MLSSNIRCGGKQRSPPDQDQGRQIFFLRGSDGTPATPSSTVGERLFVGRGVGSCRGPSPNGPDDDDAGAGTASGLVAGQPVPAPSGTAACDARGRRTPVSAPRGFRPDESAHRPRPGRPFMRRCENLAAGSRRSRTVGSATRGLRGDSACRGWSDGEAEEGKGHGANFHRWRGPEPTREACRDIVVRWLNAAEAAELPASRNIARRPGCGPRSQGPAPLSASVAPRPAPSRVPFPRHGHTTTQGRP